MKKRRVKVDENDCTIEHTMIGCGLHQLTCWWRHHFAPVGFVWFQLYQSKAGVVAQVTDSYVPEVMRRGGVRTLLNRNILKQAKVIVTSDSSSVAGMAFMKRQGYKRVASVGVMAKHAK